MHYYGATGVVASSIPATEHAVATSNILRIEKELFGLGKGYTFVNDEQRDICHKMVADNVDKRLIAEIMFMYELIVVKFPTGFISYVCDSFDFWGMLTIGLPYMKDVILNRYGRVVIRPDSGDPFKVVCGDMFANTEVERIGAARQLMNVFGCVVNKAGYREYPPQIGLIYGDSITPQRCLNILQGMEQLDLASSCCVFGVGSYTYQCNTRDTFGFAVKATYTEVEGEPIAIFKDPKTDSKKKSAKGLLFVGKSCTGDRLDLEDDVSREDEQSDRNLLTTRFEDGIFHNMTTLEVIRERLANG